MSVNLLAICKRTEGLAVKRVKVTGEVQSQLEEAFIEQERNFRSSAQEEIEFDGGWKPDPGEILFLPSTSESNFVYNEAKQDVVSMTAIDVKRFDHEGIIALAVLMSGGGKERLLLQEFSPRQSLEKKFSLVLEGDTFGRLTKPAFSIGSSLTAVLEDDKIKFRLFSRIKIIFGLTDVYQEATESEVESFCKIARVFVADKDLFKEVADQKMRRLIYAIIKRDTFAKFSANQIKSAAESQGFTINVKRHKVVMPLKKADAKALLHFLDNGLYKAALTDEIFITNSNRKYKPS